MFLEQSRESIEQNFKRLTDEFPRQSAAVKERLSEIERTASQGADISLAMRYLYAVAPLSDLISYPFETFLDFAEHGLFLWKNFARVRSLPESMFLNYVLHHRVNEEEILPCRRLFYQEISERIAGKNEAEAAKEINFWCASKAGYQKEDDRTAAALTVYRRGCGRCGEESVFLVNALRSAGIPARQVYVPRWSHCDDNHAWVEMLCDGKWYFTGACEPQTELNRGWFTNAAARAMLVHARIFLPEEEKDKFTEKTAESGNRCSREENPVQNKGCDAEYTIEQQLLCKSKSLPGQEEVIAREGAAVLLNELRRYAKTRRIRVKAFETSGTPVPKARILFQVLNSAEYVSIADVTAGEDGTAELVTGFGFLRIMARGASARAPWTILDIDTREKVDFRIVLPSDTNVHDFAGRDAAAPMAIPVFAPEEKSGEDEDGWRAVDAAAPPDAALDSVLLSPEKRSEERNLQNEAAKLRRHKTEHWQNPERQRFLAADDPDGLRKAMLEVLSPKDQADCICEVLEEHLAFALPYRKLWNRELFIRYVMNPRVEYEILRPYRKGILSFFSEEQKEIFRRNPAQLWRILTENIRNCPERERATVITPPLECLTSGIGSPRSRKVLFVAIMRTLGIPSRENPEDGAIECWDKSAAAFTPLLPGEQRTAGLLLNSNTTGTGWTYFQNWSLARLGEDGYRPLDLTGREWKESICLSSVLTGRGGDDGCRLSASTGRNGDDDGQLSDLNGIDGKLVSNAFSLRLHLRPGGYRLLTVNRLPNGNQFAREKQFALGDGEFRTETLSLRDAALSDMLEEIRLPEFLFTDCSGKPVSFCEQTAGGKKIFLWPEAGSEPTAHILDEMKARRQEFRKYASAIRFILRGVHSETDPAVAETLSVFPEIQVYFDCGGESQELVSRRMYADPDRLPLILVTNGAGNGIYASSGYQAGVSNLLIRILGSSCIQ